MHRRSLRPKVGGSQYHQQDRVYLMGDQALAMTAQIPRGSYLYMEVKKLGNIYGFTGGNFAGSVWDKEGIAPTISTMQGGVKNRRLSIVAA